MAFLTSDRSGMTFFPQRPLLRIVATAWLLASVVMLTATLLRPELYGNDRAGLAWLTPLYWLSFPLGHAGLMAGIWIRVELYVGSHIVPSAFAEGLYLWTVLSVLGYLQVRAAAVDFPQVLATLERPESLIR